MRRSTRFPKPAKKSGTRKSRPLKKLGGEATLVPAGGDHSNRQKLADALQGHYPDTTPLAALGYDDGMKAALGVRLQHEVIPVSIAAIRQCKTVGQVLDEMNKVNPSGG